ncbi:MAG TPA: hypothetical protein VED01_25075 [Burkholderiales bacterium]|nr:hypothetical protein [Burkholderiales bacterium]
MQLLLPLYDNSGRRVPHERFAQLRDELTDRYGGVTAFLRSPAQGTWKEVNGAVDRDEIVMCEVMVDALDRDWWSSYRRTLEERFGQRELIVRASRLERL